MFPDNHSGTRGIEGVHLDLSLPLVDQSESSAAWRDEYGAVVFLEVTRDDELPDTMTDELVQQFFREMAEERHGGLVEAQIVRWKSGKVLKGIYKHLDGTGFAFTGMLIIPLRKASVVWIVAAPEGFTTGVREAVVTAQMLQEGALTPETYQESWAQDPYDPHYRGLGRVDSKTLRYMSDDAIFDAQFPNHPLTRNRAYLRRILDEVEIDEGLFGPLRLS